MHIFTKVCLMKKNVDVKLPTHTNPDDAIHFNIWNLDMQQKLNFIFFGYVFLYELVSKTGALGMLNFVEFDLTVDKYCFTVYSSKSKLLINFWFFFHWLYIYGWALTLSLMVSKKIIYLFLIKPILVCWTYSERLWVFLQLWHA